MEVLILPAINLLIAIAFAWFFIGMVRHRLWFNEGTRLACQFNTLMDNKPIAPDPMDREAFRFEILEWFARLDIHQAQRVQHLEEFRA